MATIRTIDAPGGAHAKQRFDAKSFAANYSTIVIFVVLVLIASFISTSFLSSRNIENVLRQVASTGVISMGMLLVILTGGIDLSVGSVAALGSILCASLLTTQPLWIAIPVSLAAGGALGAVAGYFVAVRRMPAFVVTLAVMTIARGSALIVSKGRPIFMGDNGAWLGDGFNRGSLLGIPMPVILMLLVFVGTAFVLRLTAYGRLIVAIGSNSEAVRLSGVRVTPRIFSVYVVSGMLSALAGIVITARSGVGSPVVGIGMELDVIAAVVIGGASLMGGRGTALNTLIGVLTLGVIGNIMNLLNVPGYHQEVVKGFIILIAVLLQSSFWPRRA
ncbi:ABC transporter permease [Lichenicola cladoniae]|uniref:ABC transporter permease n=1 Tax=Lichenicola cladoniae TaxID=1484109 RepID=A0A6M8H780_9PROT|nr:ABC transporter permease [Lichenicola cladoniae]NPD66735.1 ABC transporter permease [Acetobacteraceae bacterium]QKE88683.1 ABC transporter permease [Lichenicola cladoniae]